MERKQFEKRVKNGLDYMGIGYDREKIEKLWIYLNFLLSENKKYNLSGIDDPHEVISKHFLDSLVIINKLDLVKNGRLLDVGTGAGFPGFVIKIFLPDIKLVLLDSILKRINFLQLLNEKIKAGKDIEFIHNRAERMGKNKDYRESFDCVVSRAVAPLNLLAEYTVPFLKIGGYGVLYKGPDYINELEEGRKAVELLGGEVEDVREVAVPYIKAKRYLLIIKKTDNTPSRYPRKVGIPKKRPL